MRKALKIGGLGVCALFALLIVHEVFYSAYTDYFVLDPGPKLYINGKAVSGWLHRSIKGHNLILTLNRLKHESYWITMPEERGGSVRSCRDWAAPRFPLIAIGDVNPPCFFIVVSESPAPMPKSLARNPNFGPRFAEFTADDGSRVKASW
jgi:hypothetical protein